MTGSLPKPGNSFLFVHYYTPKKLSAHSVLAVAISVGVGWKYALIMLKDRL